MARFSSGNERNTTTPCAYSRGAPYKAIVRLNIDGVHRRVRRPPKRFSRISILAKHRGANAKQVSIWRVSRGSVQWTVTSRRVPSAGRGYPSHSLASKNPAARGRRAMLELRSRSVRERGRLRVRRERRIGPGAAQEIERHTERLIVLGVRWNVGLRPRLFVALGLEVAAQRRFALGVGRPRFHFLRDILQDFDVGRDALGLYRRRSPAGCQIG